MIACYAFSCVLLLLFACICVYFACLLAVCVFMCLDCG